MREPLSKNAYRVRERFEAKHKPHPAYRRQRMMHPAYHKTECRHNGRVYKIKEAGESYGQRDVFSQGILPAPRRRQGYIDLFVWKKSHPEKMFISFISHCVPIDREQPEILQDDIP
ncbi:MAG: hypothetical protein ABIY70_09355 [Capsulimonas sp.]|uniref:hypothetical protein n=1 Tax=Capsulimonas sp. TaxID=2494211 RepID=UPI003264FAA7